MSLAHGYAYSIPVTPRSIYCQAVYSSVLSSVNQSTFSNSFSSETIWSIKLKFYKEPPYEVGTNACSNGPGHSTKMAAMPIYGKKHLKIFFSRTRKLMTLGLVCSIGVVGPI